MGETEQSVARLFAAYVDNIKAHRMGVAADELLMRTIEVELSVLESRKEDFRRSLLNVIGSLALDGRTFELHDHPALHEALKRVASADRPEPLAERGLRLLREGASPVGSMTITAEGVSRKGDDDEKLVEARRCLDAALKDDARAAKPLAMMLREGLGGPVDAARARRLYRQVADRSGDTDAHISLAIMTATGEGGPAEPRVAYQQLRPFAARGHLRAVAVLLDLAEGPDEVREAEGYAALVKRALSGS